MGERMVFPEKGVSLEELEKYMKPEKNYIDNKDGKIFLGYPQTVPHPVALKTYQNYLGYNENHVGVFTNIQGEMNRTRVFEQQFIEMLGGIYGDATVDGYITSGGTEGNLMGIWLGKKYLESKIDGEICVLKSYITHQSIEKACNMYSITNLYDVPFDEGFRMDLTELEKIITQKAQENVKRFIIVGTVGYTMTGTRDQIEEIDALVTRLKHALHLEVYVHIDAAIGGLVYPFIGDDKFAFQFKNVYSISVDPHKMGYVPFSAGVFMCRKGMLKHIAIPIKYARLVEDKTLISSRNGAAAAACWTLFQHMGYEGFVNQMNELVSLKNYMIEKLVEKDFITIVSNPNSNMVCLHFKRLGADLLPEWIEKKYTLDAFILPYKGEKIICYKIYIMPHVTIEAINTFVCDLTQLFNN